jgi:hypothetical protein
MSQKGHVSEWGFYWHIVLRAVQIVSEVIIMFLMGSAIFSIIALLFTTMSNSYFTYLILHVFLQKMRCNWNKIRELLIFKSVVSAHMYFYRGTWGLQIEGKRGRPLFSSDVTPAGPRELGWIDKGDEHGWTGFDLRRGCFWFGVRLLLSQTKKINYFWNKNCF